MKIIIKTTNLDLTDSINEYIETKLWSLNKFIDKLDVEGVAQANVEIARTTKHHHKGDIYRCEINLVLPGKKMLRTEAEQWDIRVAIDQAKDELQREIKKYNSKERPQDSRGQEINRKLRGK